MSASATTAPTTARTAQTSLSRLDKLGSTKEKRERIGLSVKGGKGGRRVTARDAQGEERLLESALRATVRATDGVATVDAGGAELDDGVVEDGRRDAGREVVQVEVGKTGEVREQVRVGHRSTIVDERGLASTVNQSL